MSASEDHQEPICKTALEGSRLQVRNPWRWLTIFQGVVTAFGNNLWDRNVYWVNSGRTLASDYQFACNIKETIRYLTSVEDICSGLALDDTNHDAGAGAAAAGRDYLPETNIRWRYLAQDRRLLQKFGWGLCRFRVFGLGLMSVENIDASIEVPGRDMPCVYVGIMQDSV